MGLTAEEREELHFVSGARAGDPMIAPALTVQQSTRVVDAATYARTSLQDLAGGG